MVFNKRKISSKRLYKTETGFFDGSNHFMFLFKFQFTKTYYNQDFFSFQSDNSKVKLTKITNEQNCLPKTKQK